MRRSAATAARTAGRVWRNHVIILPVDDLSNAACEAVANNIKGAMAIPHTLRPAAVRRRPGSALQDADRHRLEPQRGSGRGDRDRGRLDAARGRRHRRHRQAGHRLRDRAARRPRDHPSGIEDRPRVRAVGVGARARGNAGCGPVGIDQVAASRTRPPAADPIPPWATRSTSSTPAEPPCCSGKPTEITGGEHLVADRCRTPEIRERFMYMFNRYQEDRRTAQDERPVRIAAHEGQYRGGAHDHRGEGARQHSEDWPRMHGRRRARQGADAGRPRAVVHGLVVGRGGDGHAVRRGGVRGALLPGPARGTSSATPSFRTSRSARTRAPCAP